MNEPEGYSVCVQARISRNDAATTPRASGSPFNSAVAYAFACLSVSVRPGPANIQTNFGAELMNDLLDRLDAERDHGLVNAIIDTSSGSTTKFKYDKKLRCYRVSRLLPSGAFFPFNFGSIPRTVAADGDPLDIMVLAPGPLFVGCLVQVKLLGILTARQKAARKTIKNDRLIGAVVTEVNPAPFEHINQVGEVRLAEIEHFFVSYNAAQGRNFTMTGRRGPNEATEALRIAQEQYARKQQR
jgi:inorganic pyrophosphatase